MLTREVPLGSALGPLQFSDDVPARYLHTLKSILIQLLITKWRQ